MSAYPVHFTSFDGFTVLKYLREGMCYRKVTTSFALISQESHKIFRENKQKLMFSRMKKNNRKIVCEKGY